MARELHPPDEESAGGEGRRRVALRPGGWLHLDVSLGCAGDMLTAALLDLGAPLAALRDALRDAGLVGVGPRTRRERRGGLQGMHLTYVDEQGRALEVAEVPRLPRRRRDQGRSRRPQPIPRPDVRARAQAVEVGISVDPAAEDDAQAAPPPGEVLAGPGAEREPEARAGPVGRWLAGEPCRASELAAHLAECKLPPLLRALSRKALLRILEGHAQASGLDDDDWVMDGRAGLDMLCDVVGVAALVTALDPAEITSSPLAMSTAPVRIDGEVQPGPSAWALACAGGLRVVERDLPHPCTSPTGAALVWALAHRQGPRGATEAHAAGVGLGSLEVPGVANACRALWAPPRPLAAREGEERGRHAGVELRAQLGPLVDRLALMDGLRAAGAELVQLGASVGPQGEGISQVTLSVASEDVDEAVRVLLSEGACAAVDETPVVRHRPGLREVTVPVGSANKKRPVRVRETLVAGEVVRAEPDPDDVLAAARLLGDAPATLRAEALSAWRRLAKESPDVPSGDAD